MEFSLTKSLYILSVLALILNQAMAGENVNTAASVSVGYGLPSYATQYTAYVKTPAHRPGGFFDYGTNYPVYGRGYHGYFGRAYNYANFGYGGIFGGHGLPLYSGLVGLYH